VPEVFPFIGYIGSQAEHGYSATERTYANGDYRRYLRSNFNHRELTLSLTDISQSDKETITDFYNARHSSTTDFEFIIFAIEETLAVDTSALDETGQHRARFASDEKLVWNLTGKRKWATTLRVLILD
jgi:hypothetical protein